MSNQSSGENPEASSGQAAMSNLSNFKVDEYDRKHQIWKRKPLSVQITSQKFLTQKMGYIHKNPGMQIWLRMAMIMSFVVLDHMRKGYRCFRF